MADTSTLISRLVADAKPVKRLRPPAIRAGLWLLAAAGIGGLAILLFANLSLFADRIDGAGARRRMDRDIDNGSSGGARGFPIEPSGSFAGLDALASAIPRGVDRKQRLQLLSPLDHGWPGGLGARRERRLPPVHSRGQPAAGARSPAWCYAARVRSSLFGSPPWVLWVSPHSRRACSSSFIPSTSRSSTSACISAQSRSSLRVYPQPNMCRPACG